MAEGYVKDECIGFVTKYLQRFDVVYRRVWDAEEEYGDVEEDSRGQEDLTGHCTPICIAKCGNPGTMAQVSFRTPGERSLS
jgi:hypothetical protein